MTRGVPLSSAWGSHVPEYVIRLLRENTGELPLAAGEPTDVVVLFADVADFTPMSVVGVMCSAISVSHSRASCRLLWKLRKTKY